MTDRELLADLGRRIDACFAKHGITPERRRIIRYAMAMDRVRDSFRMITLGISAFTTVAGALASAYEKIETEKLKGADH